MGPWTFWLLSDPDSVGFVLSHHGKSFVKGPGLESSNPLIGRGLLTSEGDGWATQRRRYAPLFRPPSIDTMVPWLDRVVNDALPTLAHGPELDLEPAMLQLSLTMALRTLFADSTIDASQVAAIASHVEWLMAHFYHRSRSVWRFPYHIAGFNRRYHAHAQKLRDAVDRLQPEERPFDTVWPHLAPATRYHEALTLIIAGYETTGHAMAWALDLISRHPDAEQQVAAESRQPEIPSQETHPWTHAVLMEALRLYPPVWLLSRRPTADVTFQDITFASGEFILISPWLLHRNAENFPEPDAFRPERWLTGAPLHPYAFIAFSAGPRRCIGEHLAMREALIALSRIVGRYRIQSVGERGVFPGLTLAARYPLRAHLTARTSS